RVSPFPFLALLILQIGYKDSILNTTVFAKVQYLFYIYSISAAALSSALAARCNLVYSSLPWIDCLTYCAKKNQTLLTMKVSTDAFDVAATGFTIWIGLNSTRLNWTWSNGQQAAYTSWLPRVSSSSGNCAMVNSDGYWEDDACTATHPFICYTGSI
uniref:C-type lectin domain-containing protein n=1 Tax=Paramormyrops kingsleyae TaxID=1676925 RepID=A0A3B3SZ13_9TELE